MKKPASMAVLQGTAMDLDLGRIANEMWASDSEEEIVFDQACAHGERVGGHAVYCRNDGWEDGPRKCRRTWYTGGEVKDEDCEGFEAREVTP